MTQITTEELNDRKAILSDLIEKFGHHVPTTISADVLRELYTLALTGLTAGKDAERYRWLREQGKQSAEHAMSVLFRYSGKWVGDKEQLDAAIDAAISAQAEGVKS